MSHPPDHRLSEDLGSASVRRRRPRGWLIRHPLLYVALALFFAFSYAGDWLPSRRDLGEGLGGPETAGAPTLEELLRQSRELPLASTVAFVVPLICGSGLLLGYLILRAHDVRVFPRCEFPRAPWSGWDLVRCGVVFAVAARLVEAGVATLLLRQRASPAAFPVPSVLVMVLGSNATVVLTCLFIVLLVGVVAGNPLRHLGLVEKKPLRRVLLGLVGWLMTFPVLFIVGLLVFILGPRVGVRPQFQEVLRQSLGLSPVALGVVLVSVAVIAPLTEELLFRGFIYATLRRTMGPLAAIVSSAALFSFLHFHAAASASLFVIGFLLAYLYERTGSLVASISAHAANNLYSLLVVYLTFREGMV